MGLHNPIPKFPHRHNKDGSYDSICTTCFRTVGSSNIEAELRAFELKHVCVESLVFTLQSGKNRKHTTDNPDE